MQRIISVNYRQTFAQMMTMYGFDWGGKEIGSDRIYLPRKGDTHFRAKLLDFGDIIFSHKVLQAIKKKDPVGEWKPARIEHVLAYIDKFSDEVKDIPIVALGNRVISQGIMHRTGIVNIPFAMINWGYGCRTVLLIKRRPIVFPYNYQFLVVRECPSLVKKDN